jgi:hypothetical protein
VAMDPAMMAYKGTETDVLFGVESWRNCSHAHCSRKVWLRVAQIAR